MPTGINCSSVLKGFWLCSPGSVLSRCSSQLSAGLVLIKIISFSQVNSQEPTLGLPSCPTGSLCPVLSFLSFSSTTITVPFSQLRPPSGQREQKKQRKMGIILILFRLQGFFSHFLCPEKTGVPSVLTSGTDCYWGLAGDLLVTCHERKEIIKTLSTLQLPGGPFLLVF